MTFLWFIFFNVLYSLLCAFSITNAELINSLPGQPKKVTFKQYSGYITTDDHYGRALFYYFVEAQSKNSLTLPLTLWLGGDHAGSNVGYSVFTENGPFRMGKNGNLITNEFSWNLESNMLYVDAPVGMGFSYSNTSSDYRNWDDSMTANENMKFLLKWFEKFSQYRNSNFYLAGDSYGGHLVPQLAGLILQYNKKQPINPIKLKGIALGNPVVNTPGADLIEYLWYHGVISLELRTMQQTLCNVTTHFREMEQGIESENCKKMLDQMDEELGEDFSMDGLFLTSCEYSAREQHASSGTTMDDPCLSDRTWTYLNKPEVQKALHANTTGLPYLWDDPHNGPLNSSNSRKNEIIAKNSIPALLSALLKGNIPILLYSGDQDIYVPVTETRVLANKFANDLKLITFQTNRPWFNGLEIGGWSEVFGKFAAGKNVTYLTFASVRGGSHSVPSTSPSEALTLFKTFLKGSPPPITR